MRLDAPVELMKDAGLYPLRPWHLAQFRQQRPARDCGGGRSKADHRYDVIQLNPEKHGKERLEEARRLADWLTSAEGQSAIGSYETHGEQLFHPSTAAAK